MDRILASEANNTGSSPVRDTPSNKGRIMSIKLWIDDLRTPPNDTWIWAKTSQEALDIINEHKNDIEAVSFDHDLGRDDTSRRVALHMAEFECFPEKCWVHSMNPVGAKYIKDTINHYGPGVAMGSPYNY